MDARLEALERELVERVFEFHPGQALFAGIHHHDGRLEDLTPRSIAAFCASLDALRARARAVDLAERDDRIEREILLARIDASLFDYRKLRHWENSPLSYADILSEQLNLLLIFDFAPLDERLASVIAKEREIPRFLDAARQNLKPTAPILIQYGVRAVQGALSLVQRDLPDAFARVRSGALKRELSESTAAAVEALDEFSRWLREDLARGDERAYALGRERFSGWLASGERIATPLEELEQWALDRIEETRDALAHQAARIDPSGDPAAVVSRVTADHPPAGQVVEEARRIAEEVHRWMRAKGVVTFPSDNRVLIANTPEFMRWSFGSMWTPGPYETASVQAVFYATDADPSWPPEVQEEHLTAFCYRGLENLAIHEAYPGHFVQGLHQNRVVSPVRRSFWWGVFGEGWAHYCEQMALEEGFGDDSPEAAIIQLQEALNRLCRFVNGIRLHTREDWDFGKGRRFFEEEAWLVRAVAASECERGAFDPFYLRYTLGKKLILDLREECRRRLGPRFDLRAFHDALLGCGSGPMPLMSDLTRLRLGLEPA